MKENHWAISKIDHSDAFNRRADEEELKSKQQLQHQHERDSNSEDQKQQQQQQKRRHEQGNDNKFSPDYQRKVFHADNNDVVTPQWSEQVDTLSLCQNDNKSQLDLEEPSDDLGQANVKSNPDHCMQVDQSDEPEQPDIEALKLLEERLRHNIEREKKLKQQSHDRAHTKLKQASKQPLAKKEDTEVNLSFCGCGFLGIYHVGVTSCFYEYAPQLSQHKISGSSAGALVAVAHICGNLSLAFCTTDILTVAIEARSHTLGPFHPSFDVQASVREALERGLPDDCHLRATGKLHVSLTRVEDGENVIINEFATKEDLIQVLLCSCFIPFWSGLRLPKYKGVAYIDGGFSNNLLILDENTVTVSPFSGEADICPQDDYLNILQISLCNTSFSVSPNNLYRLSHALLPPAPEVLSELCEQGFADGIRYLQKMNLISCTKCLEIRSSLLVTTNGEDMEEVITMNQVHHGSTNELNDSLKNGAPSETSSVHHIILEQQEQKMIEINRNSRRSSLVSATSQFYLQHQHEKQQQQHQPHQPTPSMCIQNLLNRVEDDGPEQEDYEQVGRENSDGQLVDDCDECILIRQKALCSPMPKQFSDRIREACDKVNKSLSNWIYSHRPVKYFSYLMVPYYLPIDITLALIYRCWKRLPTIRSELLDCIYEVMNFIVAVLKSTQSRSTSAILMGTGGSCWQDEDAVRYEKELIKQQAGPTQVHHHHHHHHHHHINSSSNISTTTQMSTTTTTTAPTTTTPTVPATKLRSKSISSSTTNQANNNQPRELHSLEDTFDSIVDVTDKQEARIFAYYFRDAKNRLQVTEIFDLQRAAERSNGGGDVVASVANQGLDKLTPK